MVLLNFLCNDCFQEFFSSICASHDIWLLLDLVSSSWILSAFYNTFILMSNLYLCCLFYIGICIKPTSALFKKSLILFPISIAKATKGISNSCWNVSFFVYWLLWSIALECAHKYKSITILGRIKHIPKCVAIENNLQTLLKWKTAFYPHVLSH